MFLKQISEGKVMSSTLSGTTASGSLYPIKTARFLLAQTKRQLLVEKIKKNCGLEESHFATLYQPVIDHFAEFVQALPMQRGGKIGSMLDYGLIRAGLVLQAYQGQFQGQASQGQPSQGQSDNKGDALIGYALFTIAL